ncbi:hypothetical protein V3C41_03515 [Paenarthrobacter nicotinovorans]|uniref:Uncharacterized protein n=1 Tax=Paenarthrobacter nicotinovorans TaxID=29320 RepID=A0ABV0GNN5_PAENI
METSGVCPAALPPPDDVVRRVAQWGKSIPTSQIGRGVTNTFDYEPDRLQ